MDSGQHNGSYISRMIWTVGTPIIFFIGIVGNIITIIVLTKNRQNRSSTAVYLTVLAIADLLVMTISLPRWWLIYTFGVDIRHLSNGMCKLHWFMTYFDSALSIIILVTVTIERIISTLKPYQMKRICTVKSAVIISGTAVLVLLIFYSHILFGFALYHADVNNANRSTNSLLTNHGEIALNFTDNISSFVETHDRNCSVFDVNKTSNCSQITHDTSFIKEGKGFPALKTECWLQNSSYEKFYNGPFQIMTILSLNIIPELIFLVGGFIIVRKLTASQRSVGVEQLGPVGNQPTIRADPFSRQITLTLLIVNIVFFICTTPVLIFLVNRSVWVDASQGMTETQEIIWAIFNLMFYTNHAVNFLLYFLSGRRFRKMVIDVLRCREQTNRTIVSGNQVSSVY